MRVTPASSDAAEHRAGVVLGDAPPVGAELPGAEADDGDGATGTAEAALLHALSLRSRRDPHAPRTQKGRGCSPGPPGALDYARCLSRLAGFTTAIVPVTASASVCVVLRWARTSSNEVP